ncbi:heme lyase CcmF/NrfE family subunit [Zavarzinia sp. CC-PAN008]|uniref:heme lyase CcmF/NrfE family subunit n=1 Tax=Zavarzinia sp. CC-PAN008 TaxID=3243332 RepID=UPI003F745C11
MIAELGHFALILALVIATVQSLVPLIGAHRGDAAWIAVAQPAAVAQFLMVGISFAALTALYVESDFSVLNVAQNSHTLKPMIYKISGVWGNHEGSLLLWALILTLFGAAVAVLGRNLPPPFRARVLAIQAMIGVGFLAFLLFTSNPFLRLDPMPPEGNGLNPLLQDIGLAFHPPMLYLGYVGFSIAFSFAIAALIEGKVDPSWARWVRPWTLAAWIFLTAGIALGSHWAYYELGWGGWWFWDPVENASFMPWLAGTALLHSAIVVEKRDALKSWTILLAIITFSLSLLGTFLVRSGVLTSVHAFATDPARGIFILGFLLLVIGGSLALYAIRAPSLKQGGLFAPVSREGSLLLNNLLLATATLTVLGGTLFPLVLDALTGEKITVGPPYFNKTFVPLMIPLVVAMAVGPLLAWKRGDMQGALQRLMAAFAIAACVAIFTWGFVAGMPLYGVVGYTVGIWLVVGVLTEWAERIRLFRAPLGDSLRRARHLPRAAYGMTIAHLGIAVLMLGITTSDAFNEEHLITMKAGETVDVGGYDVRFDGASRVQGPNYSALQGQFTVTYQGEPRWVLLPQSRSYPQPPMETTEAAIRSQIIGDLYVVIGDPVPDGSYSVRLYWKPLVVWIWGGCLFMVIGGFLSLSDRRLRVGVPTRKRTPTTPASTPPKGKPGAGLAPAE